MMSVTKSTSYESGTTELVPCLPLQSAKELLETMGGTTFKRLLLPFDNPCVSDSALEMALEMTPSAELVLLHVGHDEELDAEALFTALRGLQAQTQQAGVKVDSLVKDTAVSLLDYAHEHAIDLILLPDKPVDA